MQHPISAPLASLTLPAAVLTLALGGLAQPAAAQTELDRLTTSEASFYSEFGSEVALQGDLLAIGAPSDHIAGANYTGSVHLYRRNGTDWVFEQRLLASDGGLFDFFGHAIAIDGDWIAVGAPGGISLDVWGSVHLFQRVGGVWTEQAILEEGLKLDHFGSSVALENGRLAIGAYGTHLPGIPSITTNNYVGAAWIYELQGGQWLEQQRLDQSDALGRDLFGRSIGLAGDRVLVGASGKLQPGIEDWAVGAVYAFEFDGSAWSETQKILASDIADGAVFGVELDLAGDRAVVGAPGKQVEGVWKAGVAYVLEHDGSQWQETEKLKAPWPSSSDEFGLSVAIDGNHVLVGTRGRGTIGPEAGAVYGWRREGSDWTREPSFSSQTATGDEFYGQALALDGGVAAVGAYEELGSGLAPGAAYLVDVSPWHHLIADPLPFEAGGDLKLRIEHAEPGAPTFFVKSTAGLGQTPILPGLSLDLAAPSLFGGVFLPDGAGSIQREFAVPGALLGLSVWLQSVQFDPLTLEPAVTNVLGSDFSAG